MQFPHASWSQTIGCSPDSAFCLNDRIWLLTATSKTCPLSVVCPSYLFCVPSTFVNVIAWLAMKSSSVAGADMDADVRQPLALTDAKAVNEDNDAPEPSAKMRAWPSAA